MARKRRRGHSLVVIVLLFLLSAACVASTKQDCAGLLISEVSPHAPEYVELYNPTGLEIRLCDFRLCYYSDTRITWENPYRTRPFSPQASIPPCGYYLIGFGDDWASSQLRADWCPYSSNQLSGTSGAVAVFKGTPSAETLVDAVGWGSSLLAEGVPASAPPDGLTLSRVVDVGSGEPFLDTNHNASDLMRTPPSPCSSWAGATLAILSMATGGCGVGELAIEYQLCNRGRAQEVFVLELADELGWTKGKAPIGLEVSPGECAGGQIRIQVPCDLDFYVLDLETTGVGLFDEIIEIAWARFHGAQVVQTFSSLVHPELLYIDPEAQEKHGITIEEILEAHAPPIQEILPDVLKELSGSVVVAHSARFDQRFLEAATGEPNAPLLESLIWKDTLALSQSALPRFESYELEALAAGLGLPAPQHRALPDAYATGFLFLECLKELGNTVTLEAASVGRRSLSGAACVSIGVPGLQDGVNQTE